MEAPTAYQRKKGVARAEHQRSVLSSSQINPTKATCKHCTSPSCNCSPNHRRPSAITSQQSPTSHAEALVRGPTPTENASNSACYDLSNNPDQLAARAKRLDALYTLGMLYVSMSAKRNGESVGLLRPGGLCGLGARQHALASRCCFTSDSCDSHCG